MNSIKVSIIIPIYNVEPYIERCIISVLNQSYKNIEIIIINDCTPDKSIELINKLLNNKYSSTENIHILNHEKNKGLSAARNTGIMNATGDYLYFLDSDDSITHDCIEVLVNALSLNIDFVIGDYKVYDSNKIYPQLKLENHILVENDAVLNSYLNNLWFAMAVNKLVSRNLIINKKILFPEGCIHEDELWSFMLACEAEAFTVVKKTTYNYYIREGSITESSKQKTFDASLKIYQMIVEYTKNRFNCFNAQFVNYFDRWALGEYYRLLDTKYSLNLLFSRYKTIRNIQTIYLKNNHEKRKRKLLHFHELLPTFLGYSLLITQYKIHTFIRQIKSL